MITHSSMLAWEIPWTEESDSLQLTRHKELGTTECLSLYFTSVFAQCVHMFMHVCSGAQPCLTLVTSWTIASQAPLSMGLYQQGYWSGLPFPPPGDRPHPGMEPVSPASPSLAGGFFATKSPGKPLCILYIYYILYILYIIYYIYTYLYPFICRWTFRMLPCLAIVNSAAINTEVQ